MEKSDAIAPQAPRFPDTFPRLGMGCAPLGNIFHPFTEADAETTFAAAWEAGTRFYDTAPWYGHGLSEHRLGTALRNHPREQAFISTKVGRVYAPAPRRQDDRIMWAGGLNFSRRFDYTAEGFSASYAQSQLRLGQPSIDVLVIHDLDQQYRGDEYDGNMKQLMDSGLAWLHRMKAEGQISAVGMGINAVVDFAAVADWIEVDFFIVALPYTLAAQDALHGPMAVCEKRGIKVIVGAPYASGILADPRAPGALYAYEPVTDAMRAKVLAIEAVCLAHGVPLKAAALQFPLLHPAVVSIIPGAVSADQARDNAGNVAMAIPGEMWAALKAKGLIDEGAPVGL